MLRLKRLEIDGFGPFADREVIEFPLEPGVTVIYGENMRGKTSLLNAIRYAFFGEVLGRGSRTRKLHTISNRDRATRGEYGFSVALTFSHDEVDYELVRECTPSVAEPTADSDYRESVLLRRAHEPLGPQELQHALSVVFPHEVSRFFLFDGELLQEYEELLSNESKAGRRISEAIERILGVPILKRGRLHLVQLAEQAEKEAARQASLSEKTGNLGAAQEQAMQMRSAHQQEIERKREDLAELLAEQADLERYLAGVQRYASLLDERRAVNDQLAAAVLAESAAQSGLQRAMSGAWRSLLRERVRAVRAEAREQASDASNRLLDALKCESVESGVCSVCDRPLDPPDAERLKHDLPASTGEELRQEAHHLFARLGQLDSFDDTDNSTEVERIWGELRSAQIDQVSARERLRDLETELGDSNPDEIGRSRTRFRDVADKIAAIRLAIEGEEKQLGEIEAGIQQRARQIAELGSPDIASSQRKAQIIRDAADVFGGAIERYKTDLRGRVEATASELFLAMTTEEHDYAGLTINDGYGLSIRHTDSRLEEARSAGAEHVVALALMGALQKNAPLQGPIVMDSPFGRLDEGHTGRVVGALPRMAEQVVLFVYESEVGVETMRRILGGALLREYRLERLSSRHTKIVEVR